MLKKSVSGVLASFRFSTYRLRFSKVERPGGVFPFAKVNCTGERPHKCGGYLLRSSLAAALLNSLFEHPARFSPVVSDVKISDLARIIHEHFCCNRGFAAATSLDAVGPASRQAGSPLSRSTSCSRMPPSLAAPRACLAWRLRDLATNRHE